MEKLQIPSLGIAADLASLRRRSVRSDAIRSRIEKALPRYPPSHYVVTEHVPVDRKISLTR
jgi:hypothetical protein